MISVFRLLEKFVRGLFFRSHYLGNSFNPRAAASLLSRDNHVPVILEIGGADGLDSVRFCQDFNSRVRLFVFEPDPRHYSAQTTASNKFHYTFLNVAVGRDSGKLPFHISSTPYSSSLKVPNLPVINSEWPEIEFKDSVLVSVMPLDAISEKLNLDQVDLIWADVQGAEIDLIHGAQETLKSTRYFYTEFSSRPYYEGAPNLRELSEALGPNWKLLRNYGADALFRNEEYRLNARR